MAIKWDMWAPRKSNCILALLIALASTLATVAEPANADTGAPSTSEETNGSETLVNIPDAGLRWAVEIALGKAPGEPITRGEMATIDYLSVDGLRRLTGIEYAVNLGFLDSQDGAITDLSPLAGLTSLTRLSLTYNAIRDVSPLAGLTSLTDLTLFVNEIVDISPLAGLTSLTYLSLDTNEIADVSPLAGLTSLTFLSLNTNEIADVSPLAGLTQLEHLGLSGNEIVDASTFAGLTSLTYLNLADNAITDVSPLAQMKSLTHLELGDNPIDDVSPLAHMTSLTALGLTSDPTPLAGMTWLTYLNLSGNPTTDLSALAGMTSLTKLHLRGTVITDLSPLKDLTSLKELDLSHNRQVRDLSPLSALTSLKYIGAQFTSMTDLSPLAGLSSLTNLDLWGNGQLSDLSPLAELASLRVLNVGDCGSQLRNVSPLGKLTSLEVLSIFGNGIVDLPPFAGLTSLRYLGAGGNQISDVSSLVDLTSLRWLDLNANNIADVSPLLRNLGLGAGDVLDLTDNPLNERSVDTVIPMLAERGVRVLFGPPELPEGWEVIEIADAGFRAALERRLSKGKGWWIAREEVAGLAGLSANRSAILDLAGIELAKHLRRLDVSGNAISDLAPLADSSLNYLFLDGNDIKDLRHLAGLPLSALTLSDNAIEDVAPLRALETLSYLSLDNNLLRDVPALPRSLRYLHLTNNRISDIRHLANLWLNELRLSGNVITSLSALAGQPLRYLHLNGNQVADLSPLNFASLVELHAKDNRLRDVSPLRDGEGLLTVDVRGNPLSQNALGVLETLRHRETTVLAGEVVPYFPSAGGSRTGFMRVINRNETAGDVFIEAVDDAGIRAGPVRWRIGAGYAVHLNSTDLEDGNAAKGLSAGIGRPTAGDWRLELISPLDIEVLSYVRTDDGFVTAMHDVAADATLPFFNPGSNDRQRSILRTVNTEAEPAKWVTGGYDDAGKWHPMAGSIEVLPGQALTLPAATLEGAHGLGGGAGKWRLRVRGFPWFAMSLLESPTGHLTNLSTAPVNATPVADGSYRHRLPLFPAAGDERAGFARVINHSQSAGEVAIEAVDDDGNRSGPVQLALGPRQTVHFNSDDLEAGNAAKGLAGGVGTGSGDWRLELTSALDLSVLSYIRTSDGFLTSMHDLAPRSEDGNLWIPFFNPGANRNQVSHLRLVNWGDAPATATITGVDDRGQTPGDVVRVTIPAHAAQTFTAAELEEGNADGLSGALGDGQDKWRLRVATDEEVGAMSLLILPTGHITNLSTTPRYPPRTDHR